ncbi:Tpk1p [Rhizophagus irregularis DAOM 197198w]|uniref:Tpk1p n=1 Tax=Rhizophagus irregularis (strain DAOM 197198w) TaxID=1432141 RepID=A0A015KIH9_RHIIW|nr:Tpk1p [Rhizophagus irregularis DAOM 197198w]
MGSFIKKIKNVKRKLINARKKLTKSSRIKNEICEECKRIDCNAKRFQQNFKNWTSGNDIIDNFIQGTQLSAHSNYEAPRALEWIPYDKFTNIKYVAKGGFGKVYKANWIDGCMDNKWNIKNHNWRRIRQDMFVALKSLNNSKDVTTEFMKEVMVHHKIRDTFSIIKFYGITQDPETKDYMMVLDYAKEGNLRNCLSDTSTSGWEYKFYYLYSITLGLEHIHDMDLIHRDLHTCNILVGHLIYVTDMGLCKPANYNPSEKHVYGVTPFIAPEILRGQDYTKAADIYSFGIIMYEIISGLPPHHNVCHDENLKIQICNGLRPRFNIKVPKLIVDLIKRCLDADPLNRPTIEEIRKITCYWLYEYIHTFDEPTEFQKQMKEAEEINKLSAGSIPSTSEIHPGAIYTSRLLNFNNLPEPKNSDDYYNNYDNISNMEYSGTN